MKTLRILEGSRVDIIAFDLYGNPFLIDDILLLYPSFCFYPVLPSLELSVDLGSSFPGSEEGERIQFPESKEEE